MGESVPLGVTADEDDLFGPAEQRQADIKLCELLRASGFAPVVWDPLADALAKYGLSVLEAWLRSGVIIKKCRQQGHGGLSTRHLPTQRRDRDAYETRQELAGLTVATALVQFKQSLQQGKWRPDKGRSLRTYFTAACLYAFPNVLREWQRGEDRWRAMCLVAEDAVIDRLAPRCEPISIHEAVMHTDGMLKDEDEQDAAIVRLSLEGYSTAEIAVVLGMTPGTVRRHKKNTERRIARRLAETPEGDNR